LLNHLAVAGRFSVGDPVMEPSLIVLVQQSENNQLENLVQSLIRLLLSSPITADVARWVFVGEVIATDPRVFEATNSTRLLLRFLWLRLSICRLRDYLDIAVFIGLFFFLIHHGVVSRAVKVIVGPFN